MRRHRNGCLPVNRVNATRARRAETAVRRFRDRGLKYMQGPRSQVCARDGSVRSCCHRAGRDCIFLRVLGFEVDAKLLGAETRAEATFSISW